MVLLYFTGILVGVLALLPRARCSRARPVPFVMELPNYRPARPEKCGTAAGKRPGTSCRRPSRSSLPLPSSSGSLQNFDLQLRLTADPQASILARIAGDIAPLFGPLGFADWRISTALITGSAAKESVVSSLLILFSSAAPVGGLHPGAGCTAAGVLPAVHPPASRQWPRQAGAGQQGAVIMVVKPVRRGMAVRFAGASGRCGAVLRKRLQSYSVEELREPGGHPERAWHSFSRVMEENSICRAAGNNAARRKKSPGSSVSP